MLKLAVCGLKNYFWDTPHYFTFTTVKNDSASQIYIFVASVLRNVSTSHCVWASLAETLSFWVDPGVILGKNTESEDIHLTFDS